MLQSPFLQLVAKINLAQSWCSPITSIDNCCHSDFKHISDMFHQQIMYCSFILENREMMLSTGNDKLTEALEDANKLFTGGKIAQIVCNI